MSLLLLRPRGRPNNFGASARNEAAAQAGPVLMGLRNSFLNWLDHSAYVMSLNNPDREAFAIDELFYLKSVILLRITIDGFETCF